MKGTKILAKIETRQSLLEFRHILKYADGIILSRGNMGLDIPPEKMCLVQKTIISACNMVGKPAFITRVVGGPPEALLLVAVPWQCGHGDRSG